MPRETLAVTLEKVDRIFHRGLIREVFEAPDPSTSDVIP